MDLINRLQHELAHELKVVNGSMGKINMLKRILGEESETELDCKSAVGVENEGTKEDVEMPAEGGERKTVDQEVGADKRGEQNAVQEEAGGAEEKDDEDDEDEDFAALMDENNETATVCFGVNGVITQAISGGKKRKRKQKAQEGGGKIPRNGGSDEAGAPAGMDTDVDTEADTEAETEAGMGVQPIAPAGRLVAGSKRTAGEAGCSEEDNVGWESEEELAGAEEEGEVGSAGGKSAEELELERLPVGITKIKFKDGQRRSENRFEPRLPNGTRLNRMKLGPQKSVYLAVFRQQMVMCGLKKEGYLAPDYPCMFSEKQFQPETIAPMGYYVGQIEKAREKRKLKKKEEQQREEELQREAGTSAAASTDASAAHSREARAVEQEAELGGTEVVSRFFFDDLRYVPKPASGV